jgi:hypothetical protein
MGIAAIRGSMEPGHKRVLARRHEDTYRESCRDLIPDRRISGLFVIVYFLGTVRGGTNILVDIDWLMPLVMLGVIGGGGVLVKDAMSVQAVV